jgi:hypothetical protein
MICAALVLIGFVLGLPVAAADLTLAEDGGSPYTIVIPADPSPAEEHAADELAHYLKASTGATLPIAREPDAPASRRLLVGATELSRKLLDGNPGAGLAEDAFIVRTVGGDVILLGGGARGTLYAVYSFLEDPVGCRWLSWYGDEFVPTHSRLLVPALDRSESPAFVTRDIYFLKYGHTDRMPRFLVANRATGPSLGGLVGDAMYGGTAYRNIPPNVHTLYHYVPPDKYFAEHPEFFSLLGGKRVQRQLCFSNPDLRRTLTENVFARIEETDGVGNVSVSAQDVGGAFCECPDCAALIEREGTPGAPLLDYINELADALAERTPDVYVTTLAYRTTQTEKPPTSLQMRDNAIVIFAPIENNFAAPFEHESNRTALDNIRAWAGKTKHLWVWYYTNPYGRAGAFPIGNFERLARDMRLFKRIGVEGFFIEHDTGIAHRHLLADLQTWVLARLMWDPGQDLDGLVADFTEHYYGAAAPAIREYLARLETATQAMTTPMTWNASPGQYRFLTPELLAECQKLFDGAEAVVADDPALLRRVRLSRMSLDRACLFYWGKLEALPDIEFNPEAIAARYGEVYSQFVSENIAPDHQGRLASYASDFIALAESTRSPAPLPAEFDDVPAERIRQIGPLYSQSSGGTERQPDPEAAVGMCLTRETEGELPFTLGVYDQLGKEFVARREIKADEIPSPGYNVYTIGRGKLSPSCYVWVTRSWRMQVLLDDLYDPAAPEREWDVYASLRFEGPTYPHGERGDTDRVFLDRIVLVQAEP